MQPGEEARAGAGEGPGADPEEPAGAPPPSGEAAPRVCARHPDEAASGRCALCACAVCFLCARSREGRRVCVGCAVRQRSAPARSGRRALFAVAALGAPLLVVGLAHAARRAQDAAVLAESRTQRERLGSAATDPPEAPEPRAGGRPSAGSSVEGRDSAGTRRSPSASAVESDRAPGRGPGDRPGGRRGPGNDGSAALGGTERARRVGG
ncbi:MAG: hypothetical protein D6731_07120, partial [Planctomycetota bacterium]